MKRANIFALIVCVGMFGFADCGLLSAQEVAEKTEAVPAENDDPKSLIEKASFLIGYQLYKNLEADGVEADLEQLINGIRRAASGKESGMNMEEIKAIQVAFQREMVKKQKERFDKLSVENKAKGDAYLAENGKKEGVKTIESGVQYSVLKPGAGATPVLTDTVKVHYRTLSLDGKELVSTYGSEPTEFALASQIRGVIAALLKMKVGGKWRVVVPSEMAFGKNGSRFVEPNQTLIYEIELLEIVKK